MTSLLQQLTAVLFTIFLVLSPVLAGPVAATEGGTWTQSADVAEDTVHAPHTGADANVDRTGTDTGSDTGTDASGTSGSDDGAPTSEDVRGGTTPAAPSMDPAGDISGVGEAVASADGTVRAIVRLNPVAVPQGASQEETVDTMQAEATESQQPLTTFASEREGVTVVRQFWITNAVLVEIDTDQIDPEELLSVDNVRGIHENFEVELPEEPSGNASSGDGTPVRTTADGQSASDVDTTWGVSQVNATAVWEEYGTKGDGVKVAVLDTGVDVSHPDIDLYTENASDPTYPGGWAEFDGDGDRVNGSTPRDSASHGTHTSGTVAGGNASGEYIGVAPNASLMHGMVLDGGSGSFAQIIAGMQWAVDENADVISMSLGAGGYRSALIEPVRNAHQSGTVVVAAAGNSGDGTIGSPGAVHEAITVGSTGGMFFDDSGNPDFETVDPTAISEFSSGIEVDTDRAWGDEAPSSWPDSYTLPDVAAPGWAVKSSIPGDRHAKFPGTSMATPHVSGTVALMLAASNESHTPGEVKSALYDSAWKPENCDPSCERNENDTRYGTGIVDAHAATTQLVEGETAVTGTVTDTNGDAISGADVEVGWKYLTTEDDGTFHASMTDGNYTVTATAFGYETSSTTVSLDANETVSTTFSLGKAGDAKQLTSLPDGFQAGTSATATFEVANAQSATVAVDGDYNLSDLTITVDGQRVGDDGQVDFYSDVNGEVDVEVTAPAETNGNVSLSVTFSGYNGSKTIETDTTRVYKQPVTVAVVADDEWPHTENHSRAEQLRDHLETILPINYEVHVVYGIDNASKQIPETDVFVLNEVDEDYEGINRFVDRTQRSDTGTVWLGQTGAPSDAITEYSDATGDPKVVGDTAGAYRPIALLFKPTEEAMDHPILDGVERDFEDDYVALSGDQVYHQWLENADMESLGTGAIAELGFFGPSIRETASVVAVDELERTALLPAQGYAYYMGNPDRNRGYTDASDTILANTIKWASEDQPVSMTDGAKQRDIGGGDDPDQTSENLHGQPDHVTPGSNVTMDFQVESLEELTVDVDSEFSTLTAENMTLYVDGEETAFNETRTFDSKNATSLTVTVVTDEDVTGDVSLDYTFVAGEDNETITGSTGRTAVYDGPISVPEDVDSLQGAVDLVVPGDEIVVGNGTYDPITVYSAGKYNVTIRAADGATPEIYSSNERGSEYRQPAIRATADELTISGFHLNVSNNEWDAGIDTFSPHVSDRERIVVDDAPNSVAGGFDDIVIEDVTIQGGDEGIWLTGNVPGVEVRNVEVNGSGIGIATTLAPNATITDTTVSNTSVGIFNNNPGFGSGAGVEIRDSRISDSGIGVAISAQTVGTTVVGNEIVDVDTGVSAGWGSERNLISDNEIGADVGFHFDGYWQEDNDVTNFRVTHNDVDAETGVRMTKLPAAEEGAIDPSSVDFRFNDLEDTSESVNNTLAGTFDARLNYYGDNGPATQTFAGNVVTEPFLTASPETAAEGVDDLENTPHWGIDVELEAGETYTVGVPGPAAGTVGEMFDDFEGVVYGFDESSQSWEQLTADDEVSSLDAMLVIPETDTRVTMTFAHGRDTPDAPDQHELAEGWNFVSSPEANDVSTAFAYASEDVTVVSNTYATPTVDVGPVSDIDGTHHVGRDDADAMVNPFVGYFVFSEGDGYMPAYIGEDPSMAELYEELGVERPDVSDTSMDADLDTTVRVTAQKEIDEQVRRAPEEYRDEVRAAVTEAVEGTLANTTGQPTDERVKAIELAAEKAAIETLEELAEDEDSDSTDERVTVDVRSPQSIQVSA